MRCVSRSHAAGLCGTGVPPVQEHGQDGRATVAQPTRDGHHAVAATKAASMASNLFEHHGSARPILEPHRFFFGKCFKVKTKPMMTRRIPHQTGG